jgi:hypothetical protein
MDLSNLIQSHQIFYGISSCKHRIGRDTDCIRANETTSIITLPLAPATRSKLCLHPYHLYTFKTTTKRTHQTLPNHLGTANKRPMNCKSQSVLARKVMSSITHLVHVNSSHQSITTLLVSQSVTE